MGLLRQKVGRDAVVLDRCYDDTELDAARDRLAGPGGDPVERARAAVAFVAARRHDPERQLLAQDVLGEAGRQEHAALRQVAASLDDPADRADAVGLASAALVGAAWEVRGHGMAETVGQDAGREFQRMLEDVDDLALEGLRSVPDHPGCALVRLVAARGRGVPREDMLHRFDVARRREPLSTPAHLQMLQALCAKWYGSHEAMFDLVRTTLAEAPLGHPVTMLLPVAHLELMGAGERDAAARRTGDLPHAVRLSEGLLAGDDRHPRAPEAHSVFGWFFAATGDKARARAHLGRTLLRPSWVWEYLDDDVAGRYVTVLREVGLSR